VPVGDSFSYTIRVENTGDTTVVAPVLLLDTYDDSFLQFDSAVPAADPGSGGGLITWSDLTGGVDLDPGDFVEVTVNFTALAPGSTPDTDDLAVASAEDEYGDPVGDADLNTDLTITDPRIEVTKSLASGQPSTVRVGDTVTFVVTVANTGDTVMDVVPLRDDYPATLGFASASPPPDAQAPGSLNWNDLTTTFGDLAPGDSVQVTLTFRALLPTAAALNMATVVGAVDEHGDSPPSASDGAEVEILPNPAGLVVTKVSNPPNYTPVVPGQVITYTITYRNTMAVPAVSAVITDYVDVTSSFEPGSIRLNGTPLSDDHYDPVTRLITVLLGTVGPGESGTLVFQARVNPYDQARPDVTNQATLESGVTDPVVSEPTIVLPVDPFVFTKSVTDLNGGEPRIGDILEWTISVHNTGHIPTTGVVVTDEVPAYTSYVAGSISGPGADDSGLPLLRWNVGSIGVDQAVTLTFQSRIDPGTPRGTVIRNQAVMTADQLAEPKVSSDATSPQTGGPTETLPTTGANLLPWVLAAAAMVIAGLLMAALGIDARRREARLRARRERRRSLTVTE